MTKSKSDGVVATVAEARDSRVLRVDPRDTVAIALRSLCQGERVGFEGEVYEMVTDVDAKHKFTLTAFKPGDQVIMCGAIVGKAAEPIRRGERITTRNLRHDAAPFHAGKSDYRWRLAGRLRLVTANVP